MIFTSKPEQPTYKISFGLWISSTSYRRFKASIKMEKQSATRKTALTRAPRTSARAQPNVFFDHFFGDI